MTGDRKLTEEEKAFEVTTHRFNALSTVVNEGGEPSLFEVAIIEISAKIDIHTKLFIEFGAQLRTQKLEIEELKERIKNG